MKFNQLNKQLELYVYRKLAENYNIEYCKNIVKASTQAGEILTTRDAYVHYTHIMHVAKLKYYRNHPDKKFINHKNYTQEQFDELKRHIDNILA